MLSDSLPQAACQRGFEHPGCEVLVLGSHVSKKTISGEGLCPKCGGVGTYTYQVEGRAESGGILSITYKFECQFCGYKERSQIILPLRAAYYLRYILPTPIALEVEKVWQLLRLKARLDECVGEGCGGT
jgi:hypothetical protein